MELIFVVKVLCIGMEPLSVFGRSWERWKPHMSIAKMGEKMLNGFFHMSVSFNREFQSFLTLPEDFGFPTLGKKVDTRWEDTVPSFPLHETQRSVIFLHQFPSLFSFLWESQAIKHGLYTY